LRQARFNVLRNAAAGGCASLVSQTIVVPVDLLSQACLPDPPEPLAAAAPTAQHSA
jgi:hypothetical protein